MHRGWIQLGGLELVNSTRTATYLRNGACSTTLSLDHDDSWPDLPAYLDHEPYVSPAEDNAPWYSAKIPESNEFYGIWPMEISGMDSAELERDVLESAGHGAAFGVARGHSREVEVEALLLANTPEGAEFGLQWLNAVLRGDECEVPDRPREMRFLDVAPPVRWDTDIEAIQAAGYEHERWLYGVVATEQVKVTERFGQYVKERRQATAFKVTFTLTAGNPWVWKAPRQLIAPISLSAGVRQTVRFERVGEDGECPSACPPDNPALQDPALPLPAALPRPITPAAAVGCAPIDSKRSRVIIPADAVNPFESVVPNVVIQTGTRAERYVRIQWSRGVDTTEMACDSIGEVIIGYIPAGSTFILDGVLGEARCDVGNTGVEVDATPVVTGRQGGPWRAPELRCGDEHTLTVDTEQNVAAGTIAVITAMSRGN